LRLIPTLLGNQERSEACHVWRRLAGADVAAQAVPGDAGGEHWSASVGVEAGDACVRAVRPNPRGDVVTPRPRRDSEVALVVDHQCIATRRRDVERLPAEV